MSLEFGGEIATRFTLIKLFRWCQKLNYVAVPPMHMLVSVSPSPPRYLLSLNASLHAVMCYIQNDFFPEAQSILKFYDFMCYDIHNIEDDQDLELIRSGSKPFLDLCEVCVKHKVKLLNVGASWFHERMASLEYNSPDLGIPVVSMINFSFEVKGLRMPNLESVDIRKTSHCRAASIWRLYRREWPALRKLSINVDSKYIKTPDIERNSARDYARRNNDTSILYDFFFQGIPRLRMCELTIKFTPGLHGVTMPNTEDIVASCPNLKKLTLFNWQGTNKALITLWNELRGLEEISLEYCAELGNDAFIGEDLRTPVFFKLKKLKKLTLKGIDKMPKITDTLFTLVLAHLKLSHLTLTSEEPVDKVTVKGIESLLQGGLAETIEKFPFRGWSLADASDEEFKKLEMGFRSYNML